MTTKIITIGVPYDLFGAKNLKEIKALLIEKLEYPIIYNPYDDKIVSVAMRLPSELVNQIRTNAANAFMTNLQYTASVLSYRGGK